MVQLQILNKILRTKSLDIVFDNDLTESYFGEYSDQFNFIVNHYNQYGNVPDMETFIDKFNEFAIMDVTESDEYLIDTIKEDYQYRIFVPVINKAAELSQNNSVEAVEFLKSKLQEIELCDASYGVDIIKNARSRLDEYLKKKNSDKPWMLPTGFQELDDAIGGLSPSEEFVVIVARTNQGKSWILCKIAEHIWKYGTNVGYISPEMSPNQIGYRFDTWLGHFSNFNLYTGRDVDNYEDHISDLESNYKNSFIVAEPIHFNRKITVSKLRKFVQKNNLGLLCIDGITYLTDERYRRGDNKTTSLTNISEDLMSLSCELKIPVIAVVQANRTGIEEDGGTPELESIRDSDGIAHNASKVLSIRQHNNKLKIEVKKGRNCRVGVKLCYDWRIDTGELEYNESPEDDFNEPSEPQSRFSRSDISSSSSENKQPLMRKQVSNDLPF